ncbi:N-acyl-L-homoserine lactone (AHL) synthase [Agrobacterium rhizogenes]|nr:N-acyl-L-homoserine lactone (AHL) synthase [Rhizobium rhizogenes]
MFLVVQAHQYQKYVKLLDQAFRLRKKVFFDQLGWDVTVSGPHERDAYDALRPAYLMWCDETETQLYGTVRLMPTTGPTLLYDVFRSTFGDISLVAPDIWEGTRMCIDTEKIEMNLPELEPSRAFGLLLLALCECAQHHGITTMISNYEPQLRRLYKRAGLQVEELGRSNGFGKFPVCCGAFEVSELVRRKMAEKLGVETALYTPLRSISAHPVISSAAA